MLVSNQSPEELKRLLSESIVDRINDGGGWLICGWKSLRGRLVG